MLDSTLDHVHKPLPCPNQNRAQSIAHTLNIFSPLSLSALLERAANLSTLSLSRDGAERKATRDKPSLSRERDRDDVSVVCTVSVEVCIE